MLNKCSTGIYSVCMMLGCIKKSHVIVDFEYVHTWISSSGLTAFCYSHPFPSPFCFRVTQEARKLAQQLRAFAGPVLDPDVVPRTHMVAATICSSSSRSSSLCPLQAPGIHMVQRIYVQTSIYPFKIIHL